MKATSHPSVIRSKKEITEALLSLMKTYPYNEITVKQILLESKISRKTFYRHFSCKEDVLIVAIDQMVEAYTRHIVMAGEYHILPVSNSMIDFCEVHKEMFILLREHKLFYLLLERWNRQLPLMHQKWIHEVSDEQQQVQIYLIAFNIGAIWNMVAIWLEREMVDSPETLKELLVTYLADIKSVQLNKL